VKDGIRLGRKLGKDAVGGRDRRRKTWSYQENKGWWGGGKGEKEQEQERFLGGEK
jgi:hypothetical protein